MDKKEISSRRKFVTKAAIVGVAGAGIGCVAAAPETPPVAEAAAPVRKRAIASDKAALPVGPYSQGIRAGDFIFVAGEKGLDPKTNQIVPGGIVPETRQALENIKNILAEEGATLDDAVSSTVHMTDLSEFQEMNQVYAEYFKKDPPGRTTVGVTSLPAGARVEITITAMLPRS